MVAERTGIHAIPNRTGLPGQIEIADQQRGVLQHYERRERTARELDRAGELPA